MHSVRWLLACMVVAGACVVVPTAGVVGLGALGAVLVRNTGREWMSVVPYAIAAWAVLTLAMWERRGKR